ncbi:PTPA-domain-containing protein, partial [Atractiella rhizophila]
AVLDGVSSLIDSIPPSATPQRFGNLAFRNFHSQLLSTSNSLHSSLNPSKEVLHHFNASFGNATRIDYGTGHELEFIAYLACLDEAWENSEESKEFEMFRIFRRYIDICRKLQKTYNLEPAGSRGVYGLDDHQHLSYLFGSSQMLRSSTPSPRALLDRSVLSTFPPSLLFASSLQHVHSLKSNAAPFHEHSPVLYSAMTTVTGWPKMNTGLKRMYQKEVLEAWPVVQHFTFGPCLPWTRSRDSASGKKGEELPSSRPQNLTDGEEENAAAQLPDVEVGVEATTAPWVKQKAGSAVSQPLRMGPSSSFTVSGPSRQRGANQLGQLRKVENL